MVSPLVKIAIRVLEFLFFAGWVGSCIVLLLSAIEDIRSTFEHNEEANDR